MALTLIEMINKEIRYQEAEKAAVSKLRGELLTKFAKNNRPGLSKAEQAKVNADADLLNACNKMINEIDHRLMLLGNAPALHKNIVDELVEKAAREPAGSPYRRQLEKSIALVG